ncbi:OpgC domain-containing protein [Amylibacter sp. IMCC11727]|uniref:OpgC family protein n=1 Tax=Amylibacter sp. IMCC11727 TaxID=3039851 RepID=UPI00244DB4D4|nr:OpgC domain-containing protein [Amylibacter sp. IMCC11727]WGI23247.1 OpgC domain-containing protein [Amylibacter sp. IMCC11727]
MPSSTASIATPTQRDPRLDFYRGIAMFIILVAHTPGNFLTLWIPARFGFSDATEIFVFCSGMASAIAFGKAFEHRGWFLGTARVAFRVWQVYWAHIAVFFVIAVLMATLNSTELFKKDYIGSLNLWPFFKDPVPQLMGLMTLTYVPNYFDILPMYIAILAMMPIVVGLKNMHGALAVVFVLVVWLGANMGYLAMPAEPWSERTWFFNPFGWQLVFFTGFALMSGWLPQPPLNKWLVALAILVVLATVPFAYFRILRAVPDLKAIAGDIRFLTTKTEFGLFRYLHFLALAYLGWAAAGEGGKRLIATGHSIFAKIWRVVLKIIMKVGQQSLAVFVFSMVLARLIGFAFDQTSRGTWTVVFGNLIGFALITGVAYLAAWFKSQPWRARPAK